MSAHGPDLATRLDSLYEYDREPVAANDLEGSLYFAGLYAGEHVAATEFVIGASFVSWGATTSDVLLGLLLGNLLAVLSWGLVCAPIAVKTRLTLYWYARRIIGARLTSVYNVLNALLFAILAGAMITVSASAVRLLFDIPPQTHWYPDDIRFVFVVVLVGAVVVSIAIWGFDRLAWFSTVCSPWLLLMFVVGAMATLPALAASVPEVGRIESWRDFLRVADERVWTGVAPAGGEPLSFWHLAAFAWVCNIGMSLGLADMAILRYARRPAYGFHSFWGMFLGHYVAWICAGILGAAAALAANQPLHQLDSGAVGFYALGVAGALAVVIAGWTTSNPTLYRAGLALQAVTPDWPRWKVTLALGGATTLVACFPFVFTRLLDFVGLYGMLLAPVGGIVVAEHVWLRGNRTVPDSSVRDGNSAATIAWGATVGLAVLLWLSDTVHLFFLGVPAWLFAGVLYVALSRGASSEGTDALEPSTVAEAATAPPRVRAHAPGRRAAGLAAASAWLGCLALAWWVAASPTGAWEDRFAWYRAPLLGLTALYFVAMTAWLQRRRG